MNPCFIQRFTQLNLFMTVSEDGTSVLNFMIVMRFKGSKWAYGAINEILVTSYDQNLVQQLWKVAEGGIDRVNQLKFL